MQPSKSASKPVGRKAEQILQAARKLFMEHGYGATSMDAVALESGVSKATLYAYFQNKKELFAAIVNDFSDRYSAIVVPEAHDDIRVTLQRVGRSIITLLLAPDAVAAHRMVVAEAARSPELGKLYYESGPAYLLSHLESTIKAAMKTGQLRTAHPRRAGEQFIGLVRGNLQLRALMCVDEEVTEKEKSAIIKSGVDVFYRAYQPDMPAKKA